MMRFLRWFGRKFDEELLEMGLAEPEHLAQMVLQSKEANGDQQLAERAYHEFISRKEDYLAGKERFFNAREERVWKQVDQWITGEETVYPPRYGSHREAS